MRFFGRSGRRLSVSVRRACRGRAWSARAARAAAPYSVVRLRAGAFLNVPYDDEYELLYVALVAGLVAFGLNPRATLERSEERRVGKEGSSWWVRGAFIKCEVLVMDGYCDTAVWY